MIRSKRSGFTLVELLIVIVIIGILASLLVPAIQEAIYKAKETKCMNHLREVGHFLEVYRGSVGREHATLPPQTGRAFLQELKETVLPRKMERLLQCPLEGDNTDPNLFDYRGPFENVNRSGAFDVVDPIMADRAANHGDPAGRGVQVLTLGRSVTTILEVQTDDWANYIAKTSP